MMKIFTVKKSPIKKNLIANLYGIFIQLINQVILVPFYITFWGNEQYSDWIVISSFTAFFSISDIGLNNVIQNRFAIRLAENNIKECNSLMVVNYVLVSVIFIIVILISSLFLFMSDITGIMNIHTLNRNDANIVFLLLVCRVFIDMFRNIVNAIYRAVHYASRAIFLDQTTTLFVSLLTLGCIISRMSIVSMCLIIIIPSIIMQTYKLFDVRHYYDLKFSIKDFDLKLLKEIFIPAISFMSFPAGNAIVLQGYTLVVNKYFGSTAVILYNTTRTLCNFIKTLLATLQNSVWPEYSIAYGKKDFVRMRLLHRKIMKTTIIASLILGILLLISGSFVYKIWTHGKVEFEFTLMLVYVIVIFVESLWTSSSVTLMATNNHIRLGIYYVLFTALALSIAIFISLKGTSLTMMASTLILSNVLMCLYTIPAGFKLTKDQLI